ncbi:MAG: hypothetical protein HW410_367 [Nitrosarchaeum sp.]|nr:hypothetical protein [Nitrosarchaeum sp.]
MMMQYTNVVMRGNKSTMMQDLCFKKIPEIKSSVTEVECYICGKGLHDGMSITAKTLSNGIVLFCDTHYLLQ